VCPTCQTVVDLTFENFQSLAREKPVLEKKQVTLRKQKESKQDKNQEPKAITIQQATTNNELTSMEKPEVKEILETIEPAQMEEPNIVEITLNKKSGIMGSDYDMPFSLMPDDEHRETVKEQTCQSSDVQCPYYFGYLSQKNKEEVIPETCFGCLKSIECMMSEYNKTKETVEEIKKWYSFK
jgi:DNA-directed RNA polymerase subunit N (RpoN/RPB10)